MKKSRILLVLLLILLTERFCRHQTDGFRVEKTHAETLGPHFELSDDSLLRQPFYFFGSGVQSYVFLGADGQTILKLFKHYHTPISTRWIKKLAVLPPALASYQSKVLANRQKRMESIYQSSLIALTDLKEQTGLLFADLSPPNGKYPLIELYDKIGIRHLVDLTRKPFLLQKRAQLVFPSIQASLNQNDLKGAKRKIDSLLLAISKRCQLGISNTDPIVRRNFGFIGEKAIEIDTGSFSKNPHLHQEFYLKKELYFETLELQEYLNQHSPELADYLKIAVFN